MLRAAPEAITESLAFASAGKIGSAAFNALAIQPGAAGIGALAADLIVGEDPNFKDIATEMLIELPVGSVEVLSQRLLNGSSAWKAMMMDEAIPPDSRLIKKMVEATSMEEFTEGMTSEEALVLGKVIEDSPGAEELVAKIVESQKAVEGLGIAEEFTLPREPIEVQKEELLLLAEGIRDAEVKAGVNLDVVDATVSVELEGETTNTALPQTDSKSSATQRGRATEPTYKKIIPELSGRVLDYGAGEGVGTVAISESGLDVTSHEPFPDKWKGESPPDFATPESASKIPSNSFDSIVSFSVLNVVKKDVRDFIVENIGRVLAPGGQAFITARTVSDVKGAKLKSPVSGEENAFIIGKGKKTTFQKGFTQNELESYVLNLLGDGFDVKKKTGLNGASIVVTKKGSATKKSGEMPIRPGDPRGKAEQEAAKEQEAQKIEKQIQAELREINEAIEIPQKAKEELEKTQQDDAKPKPEEKLTKSQEKTISDILGHVAGRYEFGVLTGRQGKKLTPKRFAVLKERLRKDKQLAKEVKKRLNAVKAERTKSDAKLSAQKEKFLDKERQQASKIGTLRRALVTTARDLRKKHSDKVKEIKQEAQQQARNKRWENNEIRKSITDAIRQVEALHRELNAKLPKSNKLKPMKVSDLSTKKDLEKLEDLLNKKLDILESSFKEETIAFKKAELKKELTKISKVIEKAEKGKAKTPWASDYTPRLSDYLDLLGLTKNSEAARNQAQLDLQDLNKRIDEQENYELTDPDNDIVERSQTPLLEENLTEETIDAISTNIDSIKKEGVTKRKLDVLNEKRKIKALSETIKLELSKTEGKTDAREVAQMRSFIAKYGSELATYQTISTVLTGKKRSKFESLFDSISEAFSEGILMQQRFSGKNGLLENKLKELEIDISSVGTNQLLTVGNRAMSIHEAMFVYGHNQNARGRGHLSATNFGGVALKGEQIRLINETLPQKYKDLVDFVIDYFDNDIYPRLNNIYKKRFGADMPKEERYLPITGLSNISAGSNIFNDHTQYAGFKMNNQKFRVGAKVGWGNRNLDFVGDMLSNIANTEHVIATYSTIRRAEAVFSSEAVRTELIKSNDVAVQWVNKYLQKVARGTFDSPSSAIIELTSHLRQNAAASLTALNVASWLKTFAPLIAIKKDIESGAWFNTLSDFENYGKQHEFAVGSSKLMATRRDTNRIEVAEMSEQSLRSRIIPTGETTSQVLSAYKKTSKKFKELGWAVYGALDSYSTTIAWTSKYKEVAGKTGDHNLAVKEADRIINVYYPSGRIDQLPFFFTSGGLEKQLTAFTADMNRMLNLGYSTTQLKDGKVREAIMFVAFPVVLSSLYLAGTDFIGDSLKEVIGVREEDEEKDKQFWQDSSRYAVSQFVGGIPFAGQLIEGKTAQLVGDDAAAWFLSQNNMVFTSAFQDAHRDNYVSAASKLMGVPGANYFSYTADKYLKSITKQDKENKETKTIRGKWDF
jgi:SAM-dependent methyltransferase